MSNRVTILGVLLLGASFTANAVAQTTNQSVEKRLEFLESEYRSLKEKLHASQSEHDPFSKLHFHGYGEVHYNNLGTGATVARNGAELDFHRMVLGWVYEFNEEIRFDAELDYEHAAHELELEYAQLEADINSGLSFRVGALLMPMGSLNEFHEPPNYYSVERPYVQAYLLPTTWQEIGLGIAGRDADTNLSYRLYLVNGLDASVFSATSGIRNGRGLHANSEAQAEDLALVGRIEHRTTQELTLGASGYFGGADQDGAGLGRVTVGIYEIDGHLRMGNLELHGEFARTHITNADNISTVVGGTVASIMQGWYAEAAYHLLTKESAQDEKDLVVFLRREKLDTNYSIPSGFARNANADRGIWTAGIAYYPIRKIAFKADYERWRDEDGDQIGRFNLGVGWMF